MKKSLMLSLIGLPLISANVYAGSYFSITKNGDIHFPANILTNTQGLGDYIVKNISGTNRTVYVRDLPQGFDLIPAENTTPAGCGIIGHTFSLDNNGSCTLRLAYSASVATSINMHLPTICPTSQYTIGCLAPVDATRFNVVSTPTANMTSLNTRLENTVFAPGKTTEIMVTNTGDSIANDVRIVLPSNLQAYLNATSVTRCATLGPGETCVLTLPMLGTLPLGTEALTTKIQAANAPTLNLSTTVQTGLVTVGSAVFAEPGMQTLTVSNHGAPASALSLSVGNSIYGISSNAGSTTCDATLAADSHCVYAYTATDGAYGNAIATLNYSQNEQAQTATNNMTVNNTTLAINPSNENLGQDIIGDTASGSHSFNIKNTGNFIWQFPSVARSPEDDWLSLDVSQCTSSLAPGAECTINYTIGAEHDLSSIITASGSNVSNTSQNFEPDKYISIGIEGDASFEHLKYHAIKITNLTDRPQTLSAISATPPSQFAEKIKLCTNVASGCSTNYINTCADGTTLIVGGSCHLWYKAEKSAALSSPQSEAINIGATATPTVGDAKSLSRSVNFTYSQSLYVGGLFSSVAGEVANNIAKWDGETWSVLGSGTDGKVDTLADTDAGLYVGGSFDSAGGVTASNIAKWNGSTWEALGGGVGGGNMSGFDVMTLANTDAGLYVGGVFNMAGSVAASNIAKWDGSTWEAVGGGVSDGGVVALANTDAGLYVGGAFDSAGGVTASNIAKWNGSTWEALGSGPEGPVYALANTETGLYVGGYFSSVDDVPEVRRIAKWNGTTWEALGSGVESPVSALTNTNTGLYAGGSFGSASGVPGTEHIAKWNGTTWQALASGLNDLVHSMVNTGDDLYVGGDFDLAGEVLVKGVAKWNGSAWSALDNLGDSNSFVVRGEVIVPEISLN